MLNLHGLLFIIMLPLH